MPALLLLGILCILLVKLHGPDAAASCRQTALNPQKPPCPSGTEGLAASVATACQVRNSGSLMSTGLPFPGSVLTQSPLLSPSLRCSPSPNQGWSAVIRTGRGGRPSIPRALGAAPSGQQQMRFLWVGGWGRGITSQVQKATPAYSCSSKCPVKSAMFTETVYTRPATSNSKDCLNKIRGCG